MLTLQHEAEPNATEVRASGLLDVVVLSCGPQGVEIARAVHSLTGVRRVTLVTAPYSRKRLSLRAKIQNVYRARGVSGVLSTVLQRVRGSETSRAADELALASAALDPRIAHFHFTSLHAPDCLARLAALAPDLGLVVGTHILKESVFSVPRLGSINLHCGKVPEYRGSAPGFWELYNGEREVGATIHKVTAALDAGDILLEATAPLDPAPRIDPMQYLEQYWHEVLWPMGSGLLLQAVTDIAEGRALGRAQDHTRAHTYPRPDYRAIRELRRRVKQRRVK